LECQSLVQERQHNCRSLDPIKQQKSTQALQPHDPASRVHFCSWFLHFVFEGEIDPQLTFFSDEAWLHLQGHTSYWTSHNPHLTHELPLHPVNDLCLVCCKCKQNCWTSVSLTKQLLRNVCTGHSRAILSRINRSRNTLWFQQDSQSATVHTAHMSMQALSDVFGNRIVSSGICPASSPDLNHCDFFFWGCLKDRVYNSNPRPEELEENIRREIANIPAEQLQRANQSLFPHCKECLRIEGQLSAPPVMCEQR
jgi:hypothetical protein